MQQEVHFQHIRSKIIESLNFCKSDLKIAVAWFTDSLIIKKVEELIDNGVCVSIILYDDHINKKDIFKKMYYSRANIFLSKKLMHNKFCVIDNKTVINGSYNWTLNASTNEENITITFNNPEFAQQFINQFHKLTQLCKKIDDFFDYSISSLEILEQEFEDYYYLKTKYEYPYFYDCNLVNISNVNKSNIFQYGYYLVKNIDEERNLFWCLYLLESKHSLTKISKILNRKIKYPERYDYVEGNKVYGENIYKFKNEKLLVEQHFTRNRNSYYVFYINKEGDVIGDKIQYRSKLPNCYYLINFINTKTQLVDIYLQRHEIDLIVSEVHKSIGIIGQRKNYLYGKGYKYGVLDFYGNVIVSFKYDDYNIIENQGIINLIEYSHFNFNGDDIFENFKTRKDYETKCHKLTQYNYNRKSLNSTTQLINSSNDNLTGSIFLSDEAEYFRDLYIAITENKYNFSYLGLTQLKHSKLKEFEKEFRKGYDAVSLLKSKNEVLKKQDDWNRLNKVGIHQQNKKEGCYIATMVYGDYNHPKVFILRYFRDNYLNRSDLGNIFINKYYKYSPEYVKFASKSKVLNLVSKGLIEFLIFVLKPIIKIAKRK